MSTKGPPQVHTPSVQHISSTKKGHCFSVPKIPQFNAKNLSVPHSPQFNTPLGSTPKILQFNILTGVLNLDVLNWRGVELRDFGCRPEGFELRGCSTEEGVELRVFVLNWGVRITSNDDFCFQLNTSISQINRLQ